MKEHVLSKDCWCKPKVVVVPNKLEIAFEKYARGEISKEKLAELLGVNFHTLHSALLKFEYDRI